MNEEDVNDTKQLKQKMRTHLETFLAINVMGWRDNGYGWFDTDCGICLYVRGQTYSNENWVPTYVLNQAMHLWNKMDLSADITFDCANEPEDSQYRYTIELKIDHSVGWGNTLEEAICNVAGARYGWRYEDD